MSVGGCGHSTVECQNWDGGLSLLCVCVCVCMRVCVCVCVWRGVVDSTSSWHPSYKKVGVTDNAHYKKRVQAGCGLSEPLCTLYSTL